MPSINEQGMVVTDEEDEYTDDDEYVTDEDVEYVEEMDGEIEESEAQHLRAKMSMSLIVCCIETECRDAACSRGGRGVRRWGGR